MGLLRLIKTHFTLNRNIREIERITQQIDEVLMPLKQIKGASKFNTALEYLDNLENLFNKAKILLAQGKEINRNISGANSTIAKETITVQAQTEEALIFVLALKEMIKIVKDANPSKCLSEKISKMLTWLNLDGQEVKVEIKKETLEGKDWAIMTVIDSGRGRSLDDMSLEIRKRYLGLKNIIERVGGKFHYEVFPSKESKMMVAISLEDVKT